MGITLTYRKEPNWLVVEASGEWITDDAKQAIEAIREEAERQGLTRLLIDIRNLSQPKTEMTRYFTGEHVAKLWPHPYRTAVVMKPEIYNRLGENTAKNRGAQVAVFFEGETALAWLLNGDPKPSAGEVRHPFL